jgi:hypothetical protein
MELSPGQKRGLFVVVVIVLAGLGIFLIGPGRNHSATPAASPPSGTSPVTATTSQPTLAGVPSYQDAPTVPPPARFKTANIYNWLPFTQADLDAAANVTVAFAAQYETYSYTDTAAKYGQQLSSYVTPTFLTSLQQTFQLGLPKWKQQQFTSKTGGTISSIASFGGQPQASITFNVAVTQQTTASGQAPASSTSSYQVTVVAVGSGWQVNDIEQAGVGNS